MKKSKKQKKAERYAKRHKTNQLNVITVAQNDIPTTHEFIKGDFAKILEITDDYILFENGTTISYIHDGDCETNYADFSQLDDLAKATTYNTSTLIFEELETGFRFGNPHGYLFYVPCYSIQTGYYSYNVDIYLNDKEVLSCKCKDEDEKGV